MGGWYLVTKTIGGRRYLYRQRSWREGGRVRTACQCLGRADGQQLSAGRPQTRQISAKEAAELWDQDKLTKFTGADLLDVRAREAVGRYTADGYRRMNELLRGTEIISEAEAEALSALLTAIEHPDAVLLHDVTLHRKGLAPLLASKPGDRLIDLGFLSYSVDPDVPNYWSVQDADGHSIVKFRMRVKAGTRGYFSPRGITPYQNEREVLRMGGEFIIIDVVEFDGSTIYNIEEFNPIDG